LFHIKLIDFGTSKKFHRDDKYYIYTRVERPKLENYFSDRVGTVTYMANEVLGKEKKDKDGKTKYTESCDMWSIGVVAYTILTGTLPFNTTIPKEMLKRL